jgi:DNA-binding transcriptional ArsR family regulator
VRSSAGARLFAALGDQTRLRLIVRLCDHGPASISRLTERSKVTRQAVTKHLRVMEASGLVRSTRQGRETIWQMEHGRIEDARLYLEVISKRRDAALLRLRRFVEDDTRK